MREDATMLPMEGSTRVTDGKGFSLSAISTKAPGGIEKDQAADQLRQLGEEFNELLELMFFAGQNSLLLVLQGMDTSGKDGTIRCIYDFSNCQSTYVAPFKVPTPEEMAHDYLWRVHQKTPGKGQMCIFNRSHYEDVLVVRVHEFVPKEVWGKRYDHINAFEQLLADSGTILLKFMLHISKEEQEERLLAREQEVEKSWKLSVGDWKEREFWSDYQEAYEDAIRRCSADHAPWHVIAADQKWFRNLAVTDSLVTALRPYRKAWLQKLESIGVKAKAELAEFRKLTP